MVGTSNLGSWNGHWWDGFKVGLQRFPVDSFGNIGLRRFDAFRCFKILCQMCSARQAKRNDLSMKKNWRVNGHGPLEHPGSWLMHSSCLTTLGPNPRKKRWGLAPVITISSQGVFLKRYIKFVVIESDGHPFRGILGWVQPGTTSWFVIVDNSQKLHLHDIFLGKFDHELTTSSLEIIVRLREIIPKWP